MLPRMFLPWTPFSILLCDSSPVLVQINVGWAGGMECLRKHALGAPALLFFGDLFSAHTAGHTSSWCCRSTSSQAKPYSLCYHIQLEAPHLLSLTSTHFISFPSTQQKCNLEGMDRRQGELRKHAIGWLARRREKGAEAGDSAHHSFVAFLFPNVLEYIIILGCTNCMKMSLAKYYYPALWFKLDIAIIMRDLCAQFFSVSSGTKQCCKSPVQMHEARLTRETSISAISAETQVKNN